MFKLKKEGALLILVLLVIAGIGLSWAISIGENGVSFVSSGSDANASYLSRNYTLVNITSNLSGHSNLTTRIFNSSLGLVSSNFTNQTDWEGNFSSLSDGRYYVNATAINSSNYVNSSETRTLVIDTTSPYYNITTLDSNGVVNRNYTTINVSYVDTNLANVTVTVRGLSNGVNNYTNVSSSNLFINVTGLSEDAYTINVSGCDLANTCNITGRSIIINLTSPVITQIDNSNTSSSFSITYYANKSVNYTLRYGTGTNVASTSSIADYSTSNTISISADPDTLYYYNVTVCSRAGDCITNGTYNVRTRASTTTTTTDSSSGGGGGTITQTWKYTYADDLSEMSVKGIVNRGMYLKERTRLKVSGETHYVGVVGLTSTQATINVSSTSQQAVFNIGDSKKFEVTNDNYYDLKVTLNSIASNAANVSISYIHEAMPVTTTTVSTNSTNVTRTINNSTSQKVGSGWSWSSLTSSKKLIYGIVIGILMLLGIGGIVYYLMQRRSKYPGMR